jgi:hypothetical protein
VQVVHSRAAARARGRTRSIPRSGQWKRAARAGRLVVWSIALGCAAACGGVAPAVVAADGYVVHADGRPAIIDGATSLSWPEHQTAGLIMNAEVCGEYAYLFAPSVKSVQVADLKTGRVDRRIGRPGNGPGNLRRPVGIAVDCSKRRLYAVEGPGGILAFDLDTGDYVRSYGHPYEFRASMGSSPSISKEGMRLFVPGLWPAQRADFDRRRPSQMYADTKLGLDLSLQDESSRPLTAAVEQGCEADTTACLRVDVQPLNDGSGWAASQGGGTRLGVFSPAGEPRRMIDVRSPEFRRDGSTPGARTEGQIKWGETNTTIWGVYAIQDVIAVVHARHATKDWQRGQIVQFEVFMNLYSPQGERLVSDIRLPDLPVGHDGTHVLVVDYGPGGRRPTATEVKLLKVRVRSGTEGFASSES